MTNWRALEAKVDRMIGQSFGERVRHSPMKNGAADPSRAALEISGVLHTPSPDGTINIGANIVTNMSAAQGALVVERALYPDRIFRSQDRIRGLDLPGQPLWEIKDVNDRFSSIIVLLLNEV